jgi:hypothetical protein
LQGAEEVSARRGSLSRGGRRERLSGEGQADRFEMARRRRVSITERLYVAARMLANEMREQTWMILLGSSHLAGAAVGYPIVGPHGAEKIGDDGLRPRGLCDEDGYVRMMEHPQIPIGLRPPATRLRRRRGNAREERMLGRWDWIEAARRNARGRPTRSRSALAGARMKQSREDLIPF